jgi:hypothetical protein
MEPQHNQPDDANDPVETPIPPEAKQQPATNAFGDETLVREIPGGIPPYPDIDEKDRE